MTERDKAYDLGFADCAAGKSRAANPYWGKLGASFTLLEKAALAMRWADGFEDKVQFLRYQAAS